MNRQFCVRKFVLLLVLVLLLTGCTTPNEHLNDFKESNDSIETDTKNTEQTQSDTNNKNTESHFEETSCSNNFSVEYYNDYVKFEVYNSEEYYLVFTEERKIEVNGIFENSQFEVSTSNYSITCNNAVCTITFYITQYSADYNGTIAISCAKNGDTENYTVCVNVPALLISNQTFIPINKVDLVSESESIVNKVINGERSFIDFDTKQTSTIYTLPQINSMYLGSPIAYTSIDIDNNGSAELLIQYDISGDTAIITKVNDNYIAYYVSYRTILHLKNDGTMHGSSSASEGSIHRIILTARGIEYQDILTYDTGEISGREFYALNGAEINRTAYHEQMMFQYQKADVIWMDII